ncbi:hypothetical protein HPG69_019267 [Diceros bicornis minor]|uniref:Serine/arginine repetitive matrix protein C-terminal domain-containing protein n=1 Tax=Diceros bicornis minor TaxID=77932 RepID=A0A7J7FNI4_DICBM|nr:hypothetical protein HPG69_019267 [Diceros bicornis minor]
MEEQRGAILSRQCRVGNCLHLPCRSEYPARKETLRDESAEARSRRPPLSARYDVRGLKISPTQDSGDLSSFPITPKPNLQAPPKALSQAHPPRVPLILTPRAMQTLAAICNFSKDSLIQLGHSGPDKVSVDGLRSPNRTEASPVKNTEKPELRVQGQCIMTVNISWLFRHSPQARRSAVSNGCFCFQITGSGSAGDLFTKTASPLTTSRGRSQEYDSGNDTSSPPSMQIGSARSRGQEKGSPSGGLSKSQDINSGNTSDSGNSFTTSSPQNKGATLENLSPTSRGRESRGFQSPCLECAEVKKSSLVPPTAQSSPMRGCSRSSSYASTRSSSHSSRSPNPRASPRYTRSRSTSSGKRSYSRSPSYSSKSGKRSPPSRSSRSRRSPSYSRYSPSRERDPKHGEKDSQQRERQRARRRRRSYSPMRKRRRDSPSHLEARRITSARKRPIPYYRPSPSSPSSLSSTSSWYSSSSSRSGSHSYSRSRSRSRSHSHSRSRTRPSSSSSSRSPSLGSRSRSRSYSSADSYSSMRR